MNTFLYITNYANTFLVLFVQYVLIHHGVYQTQR